MTDNNKPKVVCLSGSMRFEEHMRAAAVALSLEGAIVTGPFVNMKKPDARWATDELADPIKVALDALHFRKIDLADEVVVVSDETGYIGDSTKNEIAYAEKHGKPVRYQRIELPRPYPIEIFGDACPCKACVPAGTHPMSYRAFMATCGQCGDKQCPAATDHRATCALGLPLALLREGVRGYQDQINAMAKRIRELEIEQHQLDEGPTKPKNQVHHVDITKGVGGSSAWCPICRRGVGGVDEYAEGWKEGHEALRAEVLSKASQPQETSNVPRLLEADGG